MISQDWERKKNMETGGEREREREVRQEQKENDGECGEYRKSESESGMINAASQSCLWSAVRELS